MAPPGSSASCTIGSEDAVFTTQRTKVLSGAELLCQYAGTNIHYIRARQVPYG